MRRLYLVDREASLRVEEVQALDVDRDLELLALPGVRRPFEPGDEASSGAPSLLGGDPRLRVLGASTTCASSTSFVATGGAAMLKWT